MNKSIIILLLLPLIILINSFTSELKAQCTGLPIPDIDGNPAEWPCVLKRTDAAIVAKTFVRDKINDNTDEAFTGGASKDFKDVPEWKWSTGAPDKTDLGHTGIVMIGKKIYFFGDRMADEGNSQIGFWFFLSDVTKGTAGKFNGAHAVGDLLAISDFSKGGTAASIKVYRWNPGQGQDSKYPDLELLTTVPGEIEVNTVTRAAPNTVNDADWPFAQDWNYTSKGGAANSYPANLFFEGYFDLGNIANVNLCFSTFLFESRTSAQIDAVLKDFVAGEFDVTPNAPTVDAKDPVCVGQTLNLTASCGSNNGELRWYTTQNAGINDDIVALRGSTSVEVNTSVAGTTTYWVACVRGDLGCTSAKVKAEGIVNASPDAPTVTSDDECFGVDIVLQASCSGTGNTLRWYNQPSGGTALTTSDGLSADGSTLTKSGLAVGVHTFYVECYNATTGCVSPRSTVTGTVHDLPEVDGLATPSAAVSIYKIKDLNDVEVEVEDTYVLLLSKGGVANLTATGTTGTSPYSFVWEELDPDDVTTFSYNGTTGSAVFTVTSLVGLEAEYRFKVTLTDDEGCTATDIVTIRPTPNAQPCGIDGPGSTCENRTGLKYIYGVFEKDENDNDVFVPIKENPDFTYDWEISSGNGTITNEVVTGDEISATVTAGAPGSFTIRVIITNKSPGIQPQVACAIPVIINPDPTADAGTDPDAQCWIEDGNTFDDISGSGSNGTPSWSVDSKTNPDLNVVIQNGGTYSPTVVITHLNGSTSGGTVTLKLTVTSNFDPSCGTDVDYVDLVINAQVAGPSVTFNRPDCDEPTSSLTINSPVPNTSYRVTQPGNPAYDVTKVYSGVGALIFDGLMQGAGYSVSATVGLCTSAPEECASGLNTLLNNENRSSNTLARSPDDIKINLEAANKVNAAPNPFTDRIRFTLESAISGKGTLELYNMLGQKVQTVFEGYVEAGRPFTREYAVPQSQRTSLVYVFTVGGLRTSGKLIGMK